MAQAQTPRHLTTVVLKVVLTVSMVLMVLAVLAVVVAAVATVQGGAQAAGRAVGPTGDEARRTAGHSLSSAMTTTTRS
jgi:hypothetical protein